MTRLRGFCERLWARPGVEAIWVGGSIAAGRADRYSDVDCGVAVSPDELEAVRDADLEVLFGAPCLSHQRRDFSSDLTLHQVLLPGAEIWDLLVWNARALALAEPVITIGCRSDALAAMLAQPREVPATSFAPAQAEGLARSLEDFWVSSVKHRKVLHRGHDLVAQVGVRLQAGICWRLLHALETGLDPGDVTRQTIHGMSAAARGVAGVADVEALLGASLETRDALRQAIETMHDRVSRVGRALASRLGFDYPEALEAEARSAWDAFRSQESR